MTIFDVQELDKDIILIYAIFCEVSKFPLITRYLPILPLSFVASRDLKDKNEHYFMQSNLINLMISHNVSFEHLKPTLCFYMNKRESYFFYAEPPRSLLLRFSSQYLI